MSLPYGDSSELTLGSSLEMCLGNDFIDFFAKIIVQLDGE